MPTSVTAPPAFIEAVVSEIEVWTRGINLWEKAAKTVIDRATGRPAPYNRSYLAIIRESIEEKLLDIPSCTGLGVSVSDEVFDDGSIVLHIYVQG